MYVQIKTLVFKTENIKFKNIMKIREAWLLIIESIHPHKKHQSIHKKLKTKRIILPKTKTTATAEINNNFIQSNYDMYNSNVFNK